jgi:hypothetical protein
MSRSIDTILSEVRAFSDPQRQAVMRQVAELPNEIAAEEKGLAAQQTQAFDEILGGARRRGLGFSGIPVGEQAKYTATEYMPALARLRTAGQQRKSSLDSALADIGRNDYATAQDLYNRDRDFSFRQQQFEYQKQQDEANRRAAAAQSSAINGALFNTNKASNTPAGSQMSKKPDGGFAFTNDLGNPISAAQYAINKGIPFRELLQVMARQGDKGAEQALGFVGNDLGADPTKLNANTANIYNSLIWGTGVAPAKVLSGSSLAQALTSPGLSVRSGGLVGL